MNKPVTPARDVSDKLRQVGKMQRNIYFPRQRLGYVTVPKVANSSTKVALLPLVGRSSEEEHEGRKVVSQIHDPRAGIFSYVSRHQLLAEKPVLTFAIVRNSWSRLRSCYLDKVYHGPQPDVFFLYGMSPKMAFNDFVDIVCEIPDYLSEIHFRSQTSLLYERGQLVPDLILRQDKLDQQWPVLQAIVQESSGVRIDDLAEFNRSKPATQDHAVWTADLVRKVGRRYGAEIEMFGFAAPEV